LMQNCVVDEHVRPLVPHANVVGVPLDPPELVVPLDAPELVVVPDELTPELVVVPEELTPELVDVDVLDEVRPLEEAPLDVVVCVLDDWPRPSSPNSPSPPGPPVQATTRPIESEVTATEMKSVRGRESMV
jgi:hypothetical protein